MNRDFRDLLAAFAAGDVRCMVVGGYAVTFHSRPRFTKDLDLWVDATPANATRVVEGLTNYRSSSLVPPGPLPGARASPRRRFSFRQGASLQTTDPG